MALCVAAMLCLWLLGTATTATAASSPLMAQPAWQRLDALAADFPFAWGRRYLELKAIAEDTDGYTLQLPSQLKRLQEVTKLAQKDTVSLLLDLVPANSNVQETSFILNVLQSWMWRLEPPLQSTAATAAGLEHALEVLASMGQAVGEMQIGNAKRPIMEKASQDFAELYTLVLRQVQQLYTDMNAVRSTALGLYRQMETASLNAEQQLPQKWFAYYATPLMISSRAVARLGADFVTMCEDWFSDEYYPYSLSFALAFNILVLAGLLLGYSIMARVAQTAPRANVKRSFARSLCGVFLSLDIWHKGAFALCILVMLNTTVHTLPMLHKGIPYLYVQQIIMVVAVALWARASPAAPKIWELALTPVVGLLLLHGDAGSLLTALGIGGSLLLTLTSMLSRALLKREKAAKGSTGQSALRIGWTATLLVGLLLTVMGFGRLVTPLLMLIMIICAATAMLKMVNNSASLVPYTTTRVWFVPLLAVFLCSMSISFLVACPGFDTLRNSWNANAVPFMGINVTFGGLILTIFSLLGIIFISKISKQFLKKLIRTSQALDASAMPVLRVVIDGLLFIMFGSFVMCSLGLDVTSLAFIGGGVSIGVGFAAKTILSNFFCGLVIIFSKVVQAGDRVEIGGINGRVLSVNMRATVLETLNNGILLVPNEEMLQSRLTNWSLNNLHVLEDITISVAPESDMDTTLATLEATAAQVEGVLPDPAPKALFIGFGAESMQFVLKVWIKDVHTKNNTLSAVRIALRQALEERGVVVSALVVKRLSIHMEEQ